MQTKRALPGIVCDIDGVLVRDKEALPLAANTVEFLKKPLKDIDSKQFPDNDGQLPFICLTNGSGMLERVKAENLNYILGLKESPYRFFGHEILLNFTPLRPVMKEYHDRLVIVAGVGTIDAIATDCGLKKYITIEEYSALYPAMVPVTHKGKDSSLVTEMRKKIAERLKITDFSVFDTPLQIHAIFLVNDPPSWYEYAQIICDLLTTTDGQVVDKLPKEVPNKHIPVYCTNNDLVYAGTFKLPRFTFGAFNEILKHLYKQFFNKELQMEHYGKPFAVTYQYAETHLKEMAKTDLSNIYMIGDNPKSDIRGARGAGWVSILVETGVFEKTETCENDPEDPADYVVSNVQEAIKLIMQLEGIECQLE